MKSGRRLSGQAKVLIVAQDPLRQMIAFSLDHGTFETQAASSSSAALAILPTWRPDLLVVQIDLDKGRGMDLVGLEDGSDGPLPTIGLTLRGDIKTKLAAFGRGADDIIPLPLVPEELVARVFAVLRRSYGGNGQPIPRIKIGELEIDLASRGLCAGSPHVDLTSLERALLYLLAANAGRILSRDEILDSVWGSDHGTESNVVDRHVRNLRIKLGDSWREPRYITTIPGQGYRFSVAEENRSREDGAAK